MTIRLEGKVALVIGIGRATGERVAQDGAMAVAGTPYERQQPNVISFDTILFVVRPEDT